MSRRYLIPVVLCVATFAIGLAAQVRAPGPAPQHWRYKVEHFQPSPASATSAQIAADLSAQLDQLGAVGWEVVGQSHDEQGAGIWYTLKRPM